MSNQTNWQFRFSEEQQIEIWNGAKRSDVPLVLRHDKLLDLWNTPPRDLSDDVVLNSIGNEFRPVALIGSYELLARADQAPQFMPYGAIWVRASDLAESMSLVPQLQVECSINLPAIERRVHALDVVAVETGQTFSWPRDAEATLDVRHENSEPVSVASEQLQIDGIALSQPTNIRLAMPEQFATFQQQPCIVRL